jgi:hypothetical protein
VAGRLRLMLQATVNEAIPIQICLSDGKTNQFPRVRIYDSVGGLVTTLDLAHVANGLYSVLWTPDTIGMYSAHILTYVDSGHTVESLYGRTGEQIDVSSYKLDITRLLGLSQENSVIDEQAYNGDGDLISARVRTYDSAENADLEGILGLIGEYAITASYTNGQLSMYKALKVI